MCVAVRSTVPAETNKTAVTSPGTFRGHALLHALTYSSFIECQLTMEWEAERGTDVKLFFSVRLCSKFDVQQMCSSYLLTPCYRCKLLQQTPPCKLLISLTAGTSDKVIVYSSMQTKCCWLYGIGVQHVALLAQSKVTALTRGIPLWGLKCRNVKCKKIN